MEQGVVLLALCSRDFWMSSELLERPYRDPDGRRLEVEKLAKRLEAKAGIRLGASASKHLLGIFPGIFQDERGDLHYWDNELHEEILKAFGYHYPLIGAAAANAMNPTVGYQFADDRCVDSSLALAIVESDVAWGSRMGHGFEANRDLCVAVSALKGGAEAGYEVETLDGKPAAQRLQELQEAHSIAGGRLLLGLPIGEDYYVISALDASADDLQRGVRLTRRVRKGDRLYVLLAERDRLDRSARSIIDGAIEAAEVAPPEVDPSTMRLIWGMACTGRLAILDALQIRWQERMQKIASRFPGVPLVGALCGGEFGVDQWGRPQANTFSFWASCIASAHSKRAKNRDLQRKLIRAAGRLAGCTVPREVMETALQEAVRAGALGGQVCLVDRKIGKIVGRDVGSSLSATEPPPELTGNWDKVKQDWSKVAEKTVRDIPQQVGGQFPLNLLNYAMQVDPRVALEIAVSVPQEEDILTLITRTRRAVLVTDAERETDAKKSFFHCDTKASKPGNVRRFLAIPLVGSGRNVIATLQIGFQLEISIDRETFGLWVSFGQKIAAALERAQESEERSIREEISQLGNAILQSAVVLDDPPYQWCDDYLRTVVYLLGADGAHLRLAVSEPGGEEYRLIAAVGYLADLRFLVRPVTHLGDGSCNLKLLESGGWISNTKGKTAEWNSDVKALENADRHGRRFIAELAELEATAMLPMRHEGQLLGSFVIDSKRRYFFTERRERIARAAADFAGIVIKGRTAAYNRLLLEREKNWLLKSMAEAKEGAVFGLQSLLPRLTSAVQADAASLFIWHEVPEKLILHTSHGWFEPMDGEAYYEPNQGWTGKLAFGKKDIDIVGFNGFDPAAEGTKRYYDKIIRPGHRVPASEPDPRIGVRLKAGGKLVGVITFSYNTGNRWVLADLESRSRIIDFLAAVTDEIILAVEEAKTKASHERAQRLLEVKDAVARKLMETAHCPGEVEPVTEMIREGFGVERVVQYEFQDGRLQLAAASVKQGCFPDFQASTNLVEPVGSLWDVIQQRSVLISYPDDPRLADWPNASGVSALFGAPMVDTKGNTVGILAFSNRLPTIEHPFKSFDRNEQRAAIDTARVLAASTEQTHLAQQVKFEREADRKFLEASLASAMVIHQLKRPIGILQQWIGWIDLNRDCSTEELTETLRRMERLCCGAAESIEHAMKGGAAERQQDDLKNILTHAILSVNPELTISGVNLATDNRFRLPVRVHTYKICSGIANLLSNAIRALRRGDPLVVSTNRSSDGTKGIVSIYNPGRNYTNDELSKFMEAGMGLRLAVEAFRADAGTLELVSPASGGVQAIVKLPLIM
jgi:GAF domain-containing protein